ncbi:MAG: thiamine-phosphate kinase [Methanosarcinales archaeon]|nr:thiamine-phosphate kinase [Methanosarcinales archaeon]
MKLKDMNERDIISTITGIFGAESIDNALFSLMVGPGEDDCAVIEISEGRCLVSSTDMLHESTDFPKGITPWQMGWMSVAVNLSDIAAMGAKPIGIMMAMGLPPNTELDFVKELVEGMDACARQYGTSIIGGDVDQHDELTIVGSVLGLIDAGHLVLRKGAQVGDVVCVTGELGAAGAALDSLQNKTEAYPYVMKKLYLPVPRIREGMALARTGCLTSMMDISDGLALSLHDIGAASGVGFRINYESIPVHRTVREMADSETRLMEWSVYSGGDFELLFTNRPECVEKARKVAKFTVIGEVTANGITILQDGHTAVLEARGYQQFGDKV